MLNSVRRFFVRLFADMNKSGVPLPMVRDPNTGKGSLTTTLVVSSFNLCVVGMIGKITAITGDFDMTSALWLFGTCCAIHLGRKFQSKDGKEVNIEGVSAEETKE